MLKAAVATFAVVICSSSYAAAQLSAAKALMAEREDSLKNMVNAATGYQNTRCSLLSSYSKTDKTCNVPACGNKFSSGNGFKCSEDYGSDSSTCGTGCPGLIRSVNRSTVIFADETDFTSNTDAQAFLAYGEEYDKVLARERDRVKSWMGIGSQSGASRWFPGSPRKRGSKCSSYDPRLRSWYAAASSGPRDVVLVLDVSGSMSNADCSGCKNRLTLMKDAASALLSSFTFNDYFSIVSFESAGDARVITSSSSQLLQATQANINAAQSAVARLNAGGGTHFQSGFEKAFGLFRTSTESTSKCAKIILFLTDGIAEDGSTIDTYIAGQQALLGAANKAKVFTFAMGPNADLTRPRSIACNNGGIASQIKGGTNPLNEMAGYFKLLALAINSTKPRWVEPYIDAFGMGRMTTVSRPVYDSSKGSAIFTGVVEIDVPMSELTEFVAESSIISSLTERGSTCPSYTFSTCQVQLLRAEAGYECPGQTSAATCRSSGAVDEVASCTSISGGINGMLCDSLRSSTMVSSSGAKDYDEVVCCDGCGLAAGAVAGIVVGAIAGVIIIGALMYFACSSSAAPAAGGAAGSSGGHNKPPNTKQQNQNQHSYPPQQQQAAYPAAYPQAHGAPQPSAGYQGGNTAGFYGGPSQGAPQYGA